MGRPNRFQISFENGIKERVFRDRYIQTLGLLHSAYLSKDLDYSKLKRAYFYHKFLFLKNISQIPEPCDGLERLARFLGTRL